MVANSNALNSVPQLTDCVEPIILVKPVFAKLIGGGAHQKMHR